MDEKKLGCVLLTMISIFCLGLSFQSSGLSSSLPDLSFSRYLPVSQAVGDDRRANPILTSDGYQDPELRTALPQEFIPYLFLNPGEEVNISRPILKGGVLALGSEGLSEEKLLLQTKLIEDLKREVDSKEISLSLKEHREILSRLADEVRIPARLWTELKAYKVKKVQEVITEAIPGWKGLRIELEDGRGISTAVYFLPTISGDILVLTEGERIDVEGRVMVEEVSKSFNDLLAKGIEEEKGYLSGLSFEDKVRKYVRDYLYGGDEEVEYYIHQASPRARNSVLELINKDKILKDSIKNWDMSGGTIKGDITNTNPQVVLPFKKAFDFSEAENLSFNLDFELVTWEGLSPTKVVITFFDTTGKATVVEKEVSTESKEDEDGNIVLSLTRPVLITVSPDEVKEKNPDIDLKTIQKIKIEIRSPEDETVEGGWFTITDFGYQGKQFSQKEILDELARKAFLLPAVAELFGYSKENISGFVTLLQKPGDSQVEKQEFSSWVDYAKDKNLYQVLMEIAFKKENMLFLGAKDGIVESPDGERLILRSRGVDIRNENERKALDVFENKLLELIRQKISLPEETTSNEIIVQAVQNLSAREIENLREKAWREISVSRGKRAVTRNMECTQFIKDSILPAIESYLGFDVRGVGSTYSNAVYWLGSKLREKYRFSSEERDRINQEIRKEEERVKSMLGVEKLSESYRNDIRERIETQFAIRRAFKEMEIAGLSASLSDFIAWITKEFESQEKETAVRQRLYDYYNDWGTVNRIMGVKYTKNDLLEIQEKLKGLIYLKSRVGSVFGTPELTYQKMAKQLTDEDFMRMLLEDTKEYLLNVWDSATGLFYDTPGAPHLSTAVTGFGLALAAGLYKEGILTDDDIKAINPDIDGVKGMIQKALDTLLFIQQNQVEIKEGLKKLMNVYPLEVIKFISKIYKEGYHRTFQREEENIEVEYSPGEAGLEEIIDDWGKFVDAVINAQVISNEYRESLRKIGETPDRLSLITQYIPQISEEELKSIENYGFDGWIYHFVIPDPQHPIRAKVDTEISTVDTALLALGLLSASSLLNSPELEKKIMQFIDNINMNGMFYQKDGKTYKLAWRAIPRDEISGFTPPSYVYQADERLALEMLRLLWLVRNEDGIKTRQDIDLSKITVRGIYPDRSEQVSKGLSGFPLPIFNVSQQGTLWTYEIVHNFFDFLGPGAVPVSKGYQGIDEYTNTINAFKVIRLSALRNGFNPYTAFPTTLEALDYGYIMMFSISPSRGTYIPADGTFSPYGVNPYALPYESLATLWYQWLTNPRLWEGRFGFRDSYNPEQGFWASGYYTFDVGNFGLKMLNAMYGTIWKSMDENPWIKAVYKAAGYDVDNAKNEGIEVSIAEDNAETKLEGIIKDRKLLPDDFFKLNEEVESLKSRYASMTGEERLNTGYEIAHKRLAQVTELMQAMVDINNKDYGVVLFKYYLLKNDKFYREALEYLPDSEEVSDPELKAKVLALKFVIAKNQYWYDDQKQIFKKLTDHLGKHPDYIPAVADIIASYDYEASVMWKDWDAENQRFVPVLSREQILQDLQSPGERPRTACYPQLEEYLSKNWEPYTLFPEDAGLLMPLYEGTVTSKGEFSKGLKQLIETWGFDKAVQLMEAKFRIQTAIKPYVELLAGKKLNLLDPSGKPYGFLVAWEREVLERLKDVRSAWPNPTNPVSLDRVLMSAIEEGREDQISEAIEFTVNMLKLAARMRMFLERIYGRPLDLVYSKYDKEQIFDKCFTPIRLDLAGYARGRAISESIRNGQGNSEGNIGRALLGISADYPVNFLVTDEASLEKVDYRGQKAIKIGGTGGSFTVPLMFGDFTKNTWLEFMVSAPEGKNVSFNIIIDAVTEDGRPIQTVIPVENVGDSWRLVRIPLYGPFETDWMSDTGREKWTWISDEVWKGFIQGTLYEGKYTGEARGYRRLQEGDKWFWRQIIEAITGIEPSAQDLSVESVTPTTYAVNYNGRTYTIKDEISEYTGWAGIRDIRFQFEPGVEFYISGRTLSRGFTGVYKIEAGEYVESLQKLYGRPSLEHPAMITTVDGRKLLIIRVGRADYKGYGTPPFDVEFIDPSYGAEIQTMSGEEFEKLWNGGEVKWLQ